MQNLVAGFQRPESQMQSHKFLFLFRIKYQSRVPPSEREKTAGA